MAAMNYRLAEAEGYKAIGYSLAHFFPTFRFREDDNADGACKAYRDGICDALGIDDRDFNKLKLSTREKDAKNPRVEVTIYFESNIKKKPLAQLPRLIKVIAWVEIMGERAETMFDIESPWVCDGGCPELQKKTDYSIAKWVFESHVESGFTVEPISNLNT